MYEIKTEMAFYRNIHNYFIINLGIHKYNVTKLCILVL